MHRQYDKYVQNIIAKIEVIKQFEWYKSRCKNYIKTDFGEMG